MTTSSIEPRAAEPFADAPLRSSGPLIAIGIAAAVGIGLVSLITAWRLPGFSSASESVVSTILTLLAGFSLVGAGLEHVRRGRRRRFGLVLAAAGLAWLLAEWANPAIESSIGFTVGLLFGWLYPAVVVHAVLLFGGGLERGPAVLVVAGYAIFGVALGLVPALAFDAAAIHCSFCPDDLVAVVRFQPAGGYVDRHRKRRRGRRGRSSSQSSWRCQSSVSPPRSEPCGRRFSSRPRSLRSRWPSSSAERPDGAPCPPTVRPIFFG